MAQLFGFALPELEFFNVSPAISTGAVIPWVGYVLPVLGVLFVVQWSGAPVRVPPVRGPRPGVTAGASGRADQEGDGDLVARVLGGRRRPRRRPNGPTGTGAAMPSAAFGRAGRLMEARQGAVVAARALGMIQSLLVLALMGAAGLFVSLVTTRGAAVFDRDLAMPPWIEEVTTVRSHHSVMIEGAGLVPLVVDNLASENPVHELGAQVLLAVLDRLPNLRHNDGAPVLPAGRLAEPRPAADAHDPAPPLGAGRRGVLGGGAAPAADPPPDVPARPVQPAVRGDRAGRRPLHPRGQRRPRRADGPARRHARGCPRWRSDSSC